MTNEVATLQPNPYESYANAMSTNRIVGELLKFAKGDYFAGQQAAGNPARHKVRRDHGSAHDRVGEMA